MSEGGYREVFERLGERLKKEIIARLARGEGTEGKLAPLKRPRPDGRPLGGRLPGLLRKQQIYVKRSGFKVWWPNRISLNSFQKGSTKLRKPPRKIMGATAREVALFAEAAQEALVAEARRLGVM